MKTLSIPLEVCLGFATQVVALDHIETNDGGIITGVIKKYPMIQLLSAQNTPVTSHSNVTK